MLDHFLHVIQTGYQKYPNSYHNHCHAAEVLQTVHYMLMKLDAVVSPDPLYRYTSRLRLLEILKASLFALTWHAKRF